MEGLVTNSGPVFFRGTTKTFFFFLMIVMVAVEKAEKRYKNKYLEFLEVS